MKPTRLIGSAAGLTAGALAAFAALAGPASAAASHSGWNGASNAVFVQTDNPAGNQVAAYASTAGGKLTLAGTYDTGGRGGKLSGAVVDDLASQGSLSYDPRNGLLYAVNAGSDTVSVFSVRGDALQREQVIGSGGAFPVSVAVHCNLVYVLNALDGGSVQGYWESDGRLHPIRGSHRPLHLNPKAVPQFVNTPGQVAFSPSGSQLIVTTKANGDKVDVFGVSRDGTLSARPVVNREGMTVPFAVSFDPAGHLVIAEAGTNALATFTLTAGGTIRQISEVGTGQMATCWVAADRWRFFVSNAGSASVSDYADNSAGDLVLDGQAGTDPGTVDAAVAPGGRYLYVQTGGKGIVDEYAVSGTSLSEIGSVTVANSAGGEGIAAA